MKQMIDIEIFNNDERMMINSACEEVAISKFTQKGFLRNLKFGQSISNDLDILNLYEGLIEKVEKLSDEEWEYVKTKIPFETYYDMASNVNEVPLDESV